VEDGPTGLERWWLPESGRPTSVSFDWRFSLRAARRERMLQDLLYYRLALGQPDPDAFVAMLQQVGANQADARSLAIDLSAISRFPLHHPDSSVPWIEQAVSRCVTSPRSTRGGLAVARN
jgi:hypothetical protein